MTKAYRKSCKGCNGQINISHYEDAQNGIDEGVHICNHHLLKHVVKFYPDSPIHRDLIRRGTK